jgi:glycerol-3-phosphate dehydrogenase
VLFQHADRQTEIRTRVLVNAGGPWAQQIATRITPESPQPAVQLVQGTHILLTEPRVNNIYYLEAPQDKRAVFVMPWQHMTLVGTTETPFTQSDPAKATPTSAEIQYLQEIVAHYFPGSNPSLISSFAGLRVLPGRNGGVFGRSRELLMVRDGAKQSHVLHLYGGKLTSYRADSERVLRILRRVLPERQRIADTRTLRLEPVQARRILIAEQ